MLILWYIGCDKTTISRCSHLKAWRNTLIKAISFASFSPANRFIGYVANGTSVLNVYVHHGCNGTHAHLVRIGYQSPKYDLKITYLPSHNFEIRMSASCIQKKIQQDNYDFQSFSHGMRLLPKLIFYW